VEGLDLERRIQTTCLLILSTVSVAFALYWLKPVMIPFVLAAFIAVGLSALAEVQVRRLRIPRWLAIISTLVLAVVLFGITGALVTTSVGELVQNAGMYEARISELLERTSAWLAIEVPGLDLQDALSRLSVEQIGGTVGGLLVRTGNAILDLLSRSFLVLLFVIYLLVGLGTRVDAPSGVWGEIEWRVQRYLVTKALLSAATGILVGAILGVLGVELALVFGLMAFLLNFIPSVGSIIATLLPLPIVLVSPEISVTTVVLALALPGGVQITIGNVLEPKIMGDSLDLHPITILMMLIFWGMLWGIVGMFLATPITAVLKILFERLEHTRPMADLLAGRLGRRTVSGAAETA
jgi:AI-2 transport protein TqsA